MAKHSDHDFAVELGNIIKNRRELLYLSQLDLAEASGFHRSYISDVERGARNLAVRNLRRICGALDLPLSVVLKQVEIALERKPAEKKRRSRSDKNVSYQPQNE
jgi:transcriptional regulator with XRE-family HTH domain